MPISLNGDGIISGVTTFTTAVTGVTTFTTVNATQSNATNLSISGIATATGGIRVSSGSSIGIGTANPRAPQEIYITGAANGSTTDAIIIDNDNSNSNDNLATGIVWKRKGNSSTYNYSRIDSVRTGTHDTDIVFSTNYGTTLYEELRIKSNGGITFNGDTAAANALDDYEEGNWTPAITDGYTRTYGNRYGKYVKIGSYVYVFGQINLSTRSGSPGSYGYITLPFAANGMGQIQQPLSICQTYGFTHTSVITVAAQWDAPTELRIYETTTNANSNYLSPSGIPASGEIGFYYVFYTTS